MADIVKFRKGQIWTYKLDDVKYMYSKKTPEENDFLIWRNRPWVIWQNDYRENPNLVTAIPLTHGLRFGIPINFGISNKPGIAVISQRRPILVHGFDKFIGCLNEQQTEKLATAIEFYDGDVSLPDWLSELMKDFIMKVNLSDDPSIQRQAIAIHWSLRPWYDEQLRIIKDGDKKADRDKQIDVPDESEDEFAPDLPDTSTIEVLPNITNNAKTAINTVENPENRLVANPTGGISNQQTSNQINVLNTEPGVTSDSIDVSSIRLKRRYVKSPALNNSNIVRFISRSSYNTISVVYGISYASSARMKKMAEEIIRNKIDLPLITDSIFIGKSVPELIEKLSLDDKKIFVTLTRQQYAKIPITPETFQNLCDKFMVEFDEHNKTMEAMGR